jgi:hypothetical protein
LFFFLFFKAATSFDPQNFYKDHRALIHKVESKMKLCAFCKESGNLVEMPSTLQMGCSLLVNKGTCNFVYT